MSHAYFENKHDKSTIHFGSIKSQYDLETKKLFIHQWTCSVHVFTCFIIMHYLMINHSSSGVSCMKWWMDIHIKWLKKRQLHKFTWTYIHLVLNINI